jgi:hypothetical protein
MQTKATAGGEVFKGTFAVMSGTVAPKHMAWWTHMLGQEVNPVLIKTRF